MPGGIFPTDASTVEDVIRRADIALFNAKKEGKNRIEFYNEGIDGTSTKRLDLEKHMRKATMNECDEFTVYFQPIINVKGRMSVQVQRLLSDGIQQPWAL